MRTENYGIDENGNTILLSVEDDGSPVEANFGYADLTAGRVTVQSSHAGKAVI